MNITKLEDEISVLIKNIDEEDSIEDLITIMHSDEIKNLVKKLTDKESIKDKYQYITKLILDSAQFIYNYTGEDTGLTDTEYDMLLELLEKSDYVNVGITVPITGKNKKIVHHKFKSLRGTLDKIYQLTDEDELHNKSRRSLDDWVKTSEKKLRDLGKNVNLYNEPVYGFPKWDGVSAVFEFALNGKLDRVLTRGYTERNEAQDITHVLYDLGTTLTMGPTGMIYGVKTEVMMTEEDLALYNKRYNTNYKNSRSIVSSIINSDEVDDRVSYLKIMPLRYSYRTGNAETLQSLCPNVFNTPYVECKLGDTDKLREFAMSHKFVNGLRCDGMVIYLRNQEIQNLLGRENDKQKFEVAYKFTEETGYSTVVDMNYTIGLFGRITPVLQVKPIKLKGNTIENISLGNIARMIDLGLSKGDKVKVLYDIIPYVVMYDDDENCIRSGNKPFEPPTNCPECGSELVRETGKDILSPILQCKNPKCPCRTRGRILNYLSKMRIQGISIAIVEQLYKEGFLKSIKDVYKLHKHKKEISNLPGLGSKKISNILEEIDNHREVFPSEMLGSIGIEGIGKKTFHMLLSMITFDELIEFAINEDMSSVAILSTVPGIEEKTALKILNGIKENEKLILFLENELIFKDERTNDNARFVVVFTKIRDKDLEKWIHSNSGRVDDNVTKETDIVVVPQKDVTSSSTKKADKYGLPIIPIDEVKDYIRENIIGRD